MRRTLRARFWSCLGARVAQGLLAVGLCYPAVLHAQSAPPAAATSDGAKAAARTHFDAAMAHLEAERYAQAADELEQSVAAYRTASALFNLGNSYQALHRYVDALRTFHALEQEFGVELKPEMAASLARHVSEAQSLVAHLSLSTEPAGAKLSLNGQPLTLDASGSVELDPGDYLVRASLDGYRTEERHASLRPGDRQSLALGLSPDPAVVLVSATPAGAWLAVDGAKKGTLPLAEPVRLGAGHHRIDVGRQGFVSARREVDLLAGQRLELDFELTPITKPVSSAPAKLGAGFWVAASGTVLAAGSSVVFLLIANSKDNELEQNAAEYQNLPSDTRQVDLDAQLQALEDLQKERDTFATLSIVAGGVAVAGAAVSVLLGWDYFTRPGEKKPQSALFLTPTGVGGRF